MHYSSSHYVKGTLRSPTLLLYSNPDRKFLFAKRCSICIPSLDFAAGLASLGSSHVAILNNVTQSQTPDGLKRHKVTARSHFKAHTVHSQCEHACFLMLCVVSAAGCMVLAAGFSSRCRARLTSKPAEKIVYPTQGHGLCVICVWSLSISSRDIWLRERSTIAAVSGNSTVHKVMEAYFFACVRAQILMYPNCVWMRLRRTAVHT